MIVIADKLTLHQKEEVNLRDYVLSASFLTNATFTPTATTHVQAATSNKLSMQTCVYESFRLLSSKLSHY